MFARKNPRGVACWPTSAGFGDSVASSRQETAQKENHNRLQSFSAGKLFPTLKRSFDSLADGLRCILALDRGPKLAAGPAARLWMASAMEQDFSRRVLIYDPDWASLRTTRAWPLENCKAKLSQMTRQFVVDQFCLYEPNREPFFRSIGKEEKNKSFMRLAPAECLQSVTVGPSGCVTVGYDRRRAADCPSH